MRKFLTLSAMSFLLVIFTACGSKEQTTEVTPMPDEPVEEIQETEDIEETPVFANKFPLTGIGTEEELNRRAVGVTINNDPAARPQTGLVNADLVYEVLAEGDITRFIAFYHSDLPEKVGPVRSGRAYHIDLINGYDALMVLHGWSPEAKRLLESGKADYLNGLYYDGTLFNRSNERKAPHNSYISFENIIKGLGDERGYELTGKVDPLTFFDSEDVSSGGVEAKDITITYYGYQVGYVYDEVSGMYNRFNGQTITADHETGEELTVSNILVAEMDHRVLDDKGRRSINLTSGGNAILFQNGEALTVEWINEDDRIIAVKDGEHLPLKPGKTWINIIPTSPGLGENVTY
ncbi:DUF3048 domain-containing protein [Bacillus solitudinis]|uniref:DUF3048 domain-containing protein n=1 Tax=Bacillus solitudinis TaxID=2014074 RepID=UPI000C233267|nr:DUF3048 domain-containing protein [Bacillus solitudinis]